MKAANDRPCLSLLSDMRRRRSSERHLWQHRCTRKESGLFQSRAHLRHSQPKQPSTALGHFQGSQTCHKAVWSDLGVGRAIAEAPTRSRPAPAEVYGRPGGVGEHSGGRGSFWPEEGGRGGGSGLGSSAAATAVSQPCSQASEPYMGCSDLGQLPSLFDLSSPIGQGMHACIGKGGKSSEVTSSSLPACIGASVGHAA